MSRPTRMTATKIKNYTELEKSEEEEEEEEIVTLSEEDDDDSFDEDPDKIEVPGGGTTLENSRKLSTETPAKPTTSGGQGGAESVFFKKEIKPERIGLPEVVPTFGLPQGTTVRPSSYPQRSNNDELFDALTFLSNPFNVLQPPTSSVPTASIEGIQQLLGTFFKQDSSSLVMNPMPGGNPLQQFYGTFLGNVGGLMQGGGPVVPQRPQFQQPYWPGPSGATPIKQVMAQGVAESEMEEPVEEDQLALAETYADYKPAKLTYGKPHPDPIVETASLASVEPPEVYYQLKLPSTVISKRHLSALQLEAVVYACQQHECFLRNGQRAGFLIGDGAGVGKGRTIAGIIFENWLRGRKKALWVSVSADLKVDSLRDLRDIEARNVRVYALNKIKYGKIKQDEYFDGVLFATYSGLIGESSTGGKFNTRLKQIMDWLGGKDFDGVIVFDECHRAKNLRPVGNAKSTKTGVTVEALQNEMPNARVVYASATGASEPRNMAYMTRLGIWGKGTPFRECTDFINAVEKRGIGAMEMVAMDLKLRGAYIARQLSFQGVTFTIEEVGLSEKFRQMYNECVDLWVEAMQKFIEAAELMKADNAYRKTMWAQFWASHQRFFKYLCIAAKVPRAVEIAREAVKNSKCVVIGLQSTGEARTAEQFEREGDLDDFVSTAKAVFQNLVEKHLAAPNRTKIHKLLGLSLKNNDTPQPGTSSSSKGKPMRKAAQNAAKRAKWSDTSDNEDGDSDFSGAESASDSDVSVSTDSKASESDFESVSEELESDEEEGKGKGRKRKTKKIPKPVTEPRDLPSKEALDQAYQIRQALLDKIEQLGSRMPSNTLDQLIDDLGGPDDVAEMTGRKMRMIQTQDGNIEYRSRAESDVALDQINLTEKQRFMDGDKNIAIISEAASSGISLQSDKRVENRLKRVHITLELPWSADRAIQQFGRTHRSNQLHAPEYVFLISDLAGEHRFASIVAKRLESLGALTHGDRRATETRDLSRFHIDNKYGKIALETIMKYIMLGPNSTQFAKPPEDYPGDFRSDVAAGLLGVGLIVNEGNGNGPALERDYHNISKFLNRILGMHVDLQNTLFKFFTDTLTEVVNNARRQGRFDMGILNLGDSSADKTKLLTTERFIREHATGTGKIELHVVTVDRGMSWEEASEKLKKAPGDHNGFYVQKEEKSSKKPAVLVIADSYSTVNYTNKKGEKAVNFSVYRPTTGLQYKRETLKDINAKYSKAAPEKAIVAWEDQYNHSADNCVHTYWSGNCKNKTLGMACDVGKRKRTYHILSGSVLLCWNEVETVLKSSRYINSQKMQIVRVQFADGNKFVGILIPSDCVAGLKAKLANPKPMENQMDLQQYAAAVFNDRDDED